ncbi:alpha/beta hydrolase [Micromonospora sp. CPCC 206061]|uniref:alpha/beta hydrolase n=1 Tax=Micromonospora sp. CPCC 206061 TaxID=3122410 RepID=UPI002FF12F7A
MRALRTVAMVAATAIITVAAAAPVSAAHRPAAPGRPVSVEPLPDDLRLSGAGAAWRLRYTSTSWSGRTTVVSGTLAVPPGRPPRHGWPVVSFAPGFGGTPDACAPSVAGVPPFARPFGEALLAAGYAVAVTDYEGIGTPGESSVVHGPAEAYAVIDIVRAARRLAPVSRAWAAVGYSLGGHAALWAGHLATGYAPELRHNGTVAIAATTQWAAQFAAPPARDPAAPLNPVVPFMGRTLALTHPGQFRAGDWFTPAGMELVDLAGRVCVAEMAAAIAGVTNGDALRDPAAAADAFTALLAPHEVPIGRYREPVRLAHGTADALPAVLSEITAGLLAAAGTDVEYAPVPGADHFTVLALVARATVAWLAEMFASVPGWKHEDAAAEPR